MKKTLLWFIFLVMGVFINLMPVQKSFLPYIGNFDATTYIDKSKDIRMEGISDFNFLDFALGALNWFSLPFLLSVIDIENGYWRMMLINAAILYGIVCQLNAMAKYTNLSGSLFIMLSLLFMPFLWCWIFIPSKENIAVFGFLLLFNYYLRGEKGLIFILALFLGLFKTQVIAGFISHKVLSRIGKRYFFLSLLAINIITILVYKVFEEALSVELYLSHLDTDITTGNVILQIERIIKIPVIGILAVLIRMILYIPAGIVTVKDLFTSFEGFLMNYSSVAVGFLSLVFVFHIRRNRKNELKIFWSFLAVFLLIPFIQFRYFWWTIPIFIFFIYRKREPAFSEYLIEKENTKPDSYSSPALADQHLKQ